MHQPKANATYQQAADSTCADTEPTERRETVDTKAGTSNETDNRTIAGESKRLFLIVNEAL